MVNPNTSINKSAKVLGLCLPLAKHKSEARPHYS